MEGHLTQHISSEHPRVMVVDGSRVVRIGVENGSSTGYTGE